MFWLLHKVFTPEWNVAFFFAPWKIYFPSSKHEIRFMTFYMQYHLHCNFHSYYSYKILFRIRTVHILLYTHYSYLSVGFSDMSGHKADEVTWLKVTCVGSVNCNLAMHLSRVHNILPSPLLFRWHTQLFFMCFKPNGTEMPKTWWMCIKSWMYAHQ